MPPPSLPGEPHPTSPNQFGMPLHRTSAGHRKHRVTAAPSDRAIPPLQLPEHHRQPFPSREHPPSPAHRRWWLPQPERPYVETADTAEPVPSETVPCRSPLRLAGFRRPLHRRESYRQRRYIESLSLFLHFRTQLTIGTTFPVLSTAATCRRGCTSRCPIQ